MMEQPKPFEEQDILEKLKLRAEIRRKIGRTKDGKEDRIAATCEEAHDEIERLRAKIAHLEDQIEQMQIDAAGENW